MMKTILIAAGIAATALITAPAQSQVRVETRIDRPGYHSPHYRDHRRYEVRRVERRHHDCRMVEKRRVNRAGDVVIRRTRICG